MESKIEFIGYVESQDIFMLGQKYLGAGLCDGKVIVGMITGDINDLWNGHVWPSYSSIKHVEHFLDILCDDKKNPSYKLTKSTYKEACKLVLEHMPNTDTTKWQVGRMAIEYDISKLKNQLKSICYE